MNITADDTWKFFPRFESAGSFSSDNSDSDDDDEIEDEDEELDDRHIASSLSG